MSKKNKATPPNRDAELLAIWLYAACCGDFEEFMRLRILASNAMKLSAEMYSSKEDSIQDGIEPNDAYGVREALTKFIAELDELDRQRIEDEGT